MVFGGLLRIKKLGDVDIHGKGVCDGELENRGGLGGGYPRVAALLAGVRCDRTK